MLFFDRDCKVHGNMVSCINCPMIPEKVFSTKPVRYSMCNPTYMNNYKSELSLVKIFLYETSIFSPCHLPYNVTDLV